MLASGRIKWHESADVVVVGLGAAGAVAAITTHDAGAQVLVLEKQPAASHVTTSHMSAGVFISPNNVAEAATYMEHLAKTSGGPPWTDNETNLAWAKYASENVQWLEKLGARVKLSNRGGEHNLPGQQSIEVYTFPGVGHGLMRFLKQQVESRHITVRYETPARRLLTNTRGEVIGVRAESDGKEINVKATRGVIMAPGGFEFNEEMKLNYLRVYPSYFVGSPANTGDGYRMVEEVGGTFWHMNCCSASWVIKTPDSPIGLGLNFRGSHGLEQWRRHAVTGNPCGYVIVDKYGKRYTSEEHKRHTLYYELALFDSHKLEYPRVPSYWIFDRKRFDASPLPLPFDGAMLYNLIPWSNNNRAELEKGWIIQGNTIEELAGKIKLDPPALKKTVADYNSYCERKEDPEFHRPARHLVPLTNPPFYAVTLWPGGPNTQGGPRRNGKAQVMNADGQPIPRLYAAGEFGSVYGLLYPAGGGNIAECIAFGRIAGENAAKEKRIS
ncbi:MAG: FAD-dependent oxidoreductase [Chloroflexota bacterium]